jgi:2-polyprenyl-3-methyl-5-hydroxy-6-metoxy-1,4-benzoquinol methylase
MQERHSDRQTYFNELAHTARNYYIPYIKQFTNLSSEKTILEIGCGEGGNLLPFAELACRVTGIDACLERIEQAQRFFPAAYHSHFLDINFFNMLPPKKEERYDIILIHDVIEHVQDKDRFIKYLKLFLAPDGIVFWGFPAWRMPFGGHQQICRCKFCANFPFLHLLPMSLYKWYLKACGENESCVDELMDIKLCKTSIEIFEKLIKTNNAEIVDRYLWFINPHYEQKFNLKPRKLSGILNKIPYLRDFFSTSCFYITVFNDN